MQQLLYFLLFIFFVSDVTALANGGSIIQKGPFKSDDGLTIYIRGEGPATRETPLQVACFFEHQKGGDTLSGGTADFNTKMGGLIQQLRESGDFKGHELETLLVTPPKDTIPAEKLLLIGLGDPKTFTADRMKKVGSVAVREASKLGTTKFSFSPNVTDAGIKVVKVQDFDKQIIEGVLESYHTQLSLAKRELAPPVVLDEFTLEAGAKNIPMVEEAVKEAVAATVK
jgi:hypothetical protein